MRPHFYGMGRIASPATDNHPDRFLALQDAMADDVSNICLSAIEAGWKPEEVVAALVELADNMMLGLITNRNTERDILQYLRR